MAHAPRGARLWLGALAFSGVVVAHWLSYAVTVPDAHARATLLDHTGHGYWTAMVAGALGGLVAGLAGFALSGCRTRGTSLWAASASRLALLQVSGFVILETTERLIAGAVTDGASQRVLLAGIAVQIIVALFGALLLTFLARTIDVVAARRRAPTKIRRPHLGRPRSWLGALRPGVATGGATLRGPPSP